MKGLTGKQAEAVQGVAQDAWQSVGADVLACAAEEGEATVSKGAVVEMVLDCERLEQYARTPEQREAVAALRLLSYEQQKRAVGPAFPFRRYGY